MAGDQIREYVIKIRAEVKDALAQIDQLKGKFDKVELKTNVDKSFGQQIEKLSGSIGKITQEMGELKTSFKDVDFKSFTGDMKQSFDELKTSIDDIKNSAKTLAEAFDFSGNGKQNSLASFVTDLKQQMSDLLNSYTEAANKLKDLQDSGFTIPQIDTSSVGASTGSVQTQLQQAKNELDDFKKLADVKKQTLDLIKEIAQAQKKDQRYIDMAASEDSPMSGGAYQPSDYSRARDQLARLQDLLKVTGEIKDVKDALQEAGLSQSEISKAKNALGKRVDAMLKESIAEINPSAEPQRMRVQLNYDIAESDDKDALKQKAIEIAQKIQSEVQQIIQDEVSKNPINIPLSIGASDSELLDEQNKDKVLEAIEIPVKPITDGLLEDINTKIQDISDQVTTIDVKINPILPDNIKADKINWDVSKITDAENAIQGEGKAAEIAAKQKDLFRQANANIAADTPKTTEAVKAATKAIEAEGKISAKGTEKIAPNVIPASSFVDNPTIHVENATIIDDSSNQPKTQDNIMYGPSDRQIITDGDFGVDPPRKKRKYLSQILAPTAIKGRTTLDQMSAFWEGNDYSDVKKTSKELFNYAMESLFKDIQASTRTKDDILGRDYYTKGITVNDHTYAFYGKPGQTLEDFQGQILDVFTLAREAIGRYRDDLHETMQQERKVSSKDDLVDSGVDGRKVTPWMKRIIDADKRKEQNELRTDQIKKMIQENEANDPKFIEKAKDGFLKEFDESIDSLKRQRDEIIKENKEYSDLNRQFSDTKRILPQISSSKSRDDFATWYGGLRDDSNVKKIADMFSVQSLLDPNNDFDKTRTEISNAIASYLETINAELGSQAQIFEKNKKRLERIDKSIENTTTAREQMASASKPNVMKEVVRRRHQTARVSLVDANENGLTTEFEKELQDIEKKEIKRYTTQVARKAIRNQIEVVDTNRRSGLVSDLKDKFQKYKNQNESSFKNADSSQRSQLIQKFVNENRKLVEDIQAENQFLRAVRGELPEDKLDQNKLYIERGKDNSQLRKNGFGVDALRKPNEKGVSIIDVKNEQSLKLLRKLEESGWFVDERTGLLASSSGKVVKTKTEGSNDLYDRIMDIGRYGQERLDQQIAIIEALAENEHLIRSYIKHYEDTIQNGGYNEEGTLAVGSQIGELDQSTLTSNLIEKFPNLKSLNPQQMYEFAQEYMDELSDSRRKQIEITDNIKDVITKTVDIQMKRKITEKGYNEAIKELGEVDREIVALENRMEKVSGKVTSLNLKTGKEKVTYGVDPRTVTPFEQQRYYDLKSRQKDLRDQIFGYEMSQGMRSWSGELISKQSLDVLRKNNGRVINYGLPSELSGRYSKIPDPNSVSKPFIDKDGIQINGMREAVGLTTDQLREFVTTLQVTNEGIRESLGKFPQTSEEIQAYVDRHVKEDIDSLVSVRNSMVQDLKTRFQEYKKQHEEEFMLADTTQKTELTKSFIKRNRGLVKDISSSNKAIRMLRDDEPIAQTAKILSNDKKIDELNTRQDELSKFIIEQISDSGDSAVFMKEELSELSRLREYESGARKELDDYTHEYATDKYSRGKIEEDEGYIERRDYYETIRNKRKQAEKKVIGRLPLKDDLYKTETGSLGQTQNSSLTGSAIEELLDVIERREQLESDNFALRQLVGSDTKTARSEREEVWRENLKSQRKDLEGAIKQNESSIKQFEQLIQNDAEVKKRDAAIKERQQSEEALRQRKAEKFQEISAKASTPKEQLLAQVTAEKDAISTQIGTEISALRDNLSSITTQIETANTELSSEFESKESIVSSLKQNISEAQSRLTSILTENLKSAFESDETINELNKQLQNARASGALYRNIRTIENQIENRENEIISEYSEKIIDDIYAIQDAIDENASKDTIRQLSNNLLLSHRQYQSAFGKEYTPEDFINGNQDPIEFAKEHGDLEEHIIHTNQQRLALAEEDVRATEVRLKESQEALDVVKGISKAAAEENNLAQQYISTKKQLDDKETELRTENQKRLEEIDYINKGDQKAYESLLVRQNGLDQIEYNNWKNGHWNEEKYSKENVDRKIAGGKKAKELEHEEAIIRKQEIMEKQIAERLRYEQVLQDKEAKDESKKQKGQVSSSQPKNSQRKQDEYQPQYIPDEHEQENYDAYNKMYESEQGLTKATVDASLATDEAIRKEQELAQARADQSKQTATLPPSQRKLTKQEQESISLENASSRDDFINRVKTGLGFDRLLGSNNGNTSWFRSIEQMQKYGFTDMTAWLKETGGKHGDFENRLNLLADHYYQSAEASETAGQAEQTQTQQSERLAQASDAAASSVQNLSDKVIEFADVKSKINENEVLKQEQKAASPQKALANKSQKLEPPKITKDGIDFNGKHYSLLPEKQRIDTRSSKGLKAIYNDASKRGRTSWTPKNAVKYLDAYSMTGNQDFILGLEASMQKGQKTATLKTEYKNEIKKFILKQLMSDINPGEYKDQLNSEYTKLANQMMKKGSKLQPSEANQLIRQHLAQLQGTTLPSQPTSTVADTSGIEQQTEKLKEVEEQAHRTAEAISEIKQISGLTPEQQHEYEEWATEIMARGQDDISVGTLTGEDVAQELAKLEAEYIAIGQASIGSTGKAATGIDQIEQEAKEATPAVIDLKNALESIRQIYSSSGREGLLSSLTALSAKDMRKIAEDNGYVNAKGKLPKSLNKTQLAGLIADNYEKSLTPALTETKAQAESTTESVVAETQASGTADTSGTQQQIDKMHELTAAVSEARSEVTSVGSATSEKVPQYLFHARDNYNPEKSRKTHVLGKNGSLHELDMANLTGLFTTSNIDALSDLGKPITTIDASMYNTLKVATDQMADNISLFFNEVSGFISSSVSTGINDNRLRAVFDEYKKVIPNAVMEFEEFTQFINECVSIAKQYGLNDDTKFGMIPSARKNTPESTGLPEDIFNRDSFITELLKKSGYEGVDVSGTQLDNLVAGGSVIFDVKPDSIIALNKSLEETKQLTQSIQDQSPISSTTITEQKTDIQPAIEQQNQLQAELSETTAKAQEASVAINNLNDSMITFETDATKGARLSSDKLPVLSDNGRVLGASKRNNIPYSIEEFENNQGLAEKVLAANGPKFNTDYWTQSKANAQEYINTAKEAVAVTQQAQVQLQDNSKAVDSSSAQAEASRSSADSMTNEAAAAKEAESALLAKAAAEQQAAESSRQLAQASQQSADTAKLQAKTPEVVPQASVEKQTKTTVKTSQQQLPGDTTTLPGAETESGSFSGLVTTLTQTIPQAVATKNEAFEQELSLVRDVASQEAQAFDQLISKLEKIAGLATNFKFDFSIKGGEQFNDDFLTNFGKLKTEVDGIDPTKFTAIGDAFSGIGKSLTNKKDLSQYFIDLGTAIKTFSESMNTIDISDNFSSISNMIDKIANAGSALKNALTLMKEQKSSYDYKYGTDQETDQQVKDLLKQAQYLSTPNNVSKASKYGMQYAQFQAGDTSKALTTEQYTWWEDYKRQSADFENSFSSLQNSLKLTADGYDALSDAMNRLNDNRESSIRGMAIEEQKTKDFSNQLRGMQERINQIPEQEKQAYAGAVGRLQNRFDEASQGLSSGKIVWQEYTEQMKAAWKEYDRFKKANPAGSIQLMSGVTGSSEDVMKQIQSTLSQRYKLVTQNVSGGAIDSNGMARFSAQVVDANNNVQNLKITWDTFNNTVSATANTASEQFKGRFMSLISDLQAKSKQLFIYWTATFMNPYRLIGVGKQAISIIKELDTAMMELRKVSSESAESYQDFQQKSFDMADQVGGTAKDIIQATTNWKKLGKSFEESQEAGQASVKLLNVSEFQNIDDATTALVSMKQAFNDLSYDDFIDKLNAVGDSYSSATDQLAEGMKNVSAVMKVQGNDIDQTLALLTAANDVTQDISKSAMGITYAQTYRDVWVFYILVSSYIG